MITIVVIEGVLARSDDLKNAQPTKQAKALYDGLHLTNNMVGLTRASPDIAKWWLKREHLSDWANVMSYPGNALTWERWCVDQVRSFLAEGWEIFAYVDTNAQVCEEMRALGVATMTLSYPTSPLGWKEVAVPRAWADIATTVGDSAPWKD